MLQMKSKWLFCALLLGTSMFVAACGDTSLTEPISNNESPSSMEQGVTAIDDGRWNKAIGLLTPLPDSDAKRKYLASAYMGRSGFDTLKLFRLIDAAPVGDPTVVWTTIGSIYDLDGDGLIALAELEESRADVVNALSVLLTGAVGNPYTAADGSNLSTPRKFQTGVAAAADLVLSVSAQLDAGGGFVVINPQAFVGPLPSLGGVPPTLDTDLVLMLNAVEAVQATTNNDVASAFDAFLVAIGFADDSTVTLAELTAYLTTLAAL